MPSSSLANALIVPTPPLPPIGISTYSIALSYYSTGQPFKTSSLCLSLLIKAECFGNSKIVFGNERGPYRLISEEHMLRALLLIKSDPADLLENAGWGFPIHCRRCAFECLRMRKSFANHSQKLTIILHKPLRQFPDCSLIHAHTWFCNRCYAHAGFSGGTYGI